MSSAEPGEETQIAGRYHVENTLGKGGMGAVYCVYDASSGKRVALKRLLKHVADKNPKVAVLFQREYHTLAQLEHPLVIRAFDYGVDEAGPYYTMELLDGSDLRELAPLPWREACRLLRDVCLSLSLLHSRRMIHRDVAPRNVRCTKDGSAKLIDFGAMAPMGVNKTLVGTPPFLPPEAIAGQPLDGRADLYSVGALAYWMLTRRHAYPARHMRELKDVWRSKPADLAALVPGIPKALNELIMRLLSLDVLARPVNAAEVIDRLRAIADLAPVDQSLMAQAYLTTPTLVGRENELFSFRKRILRAIRGRGAAFYVQGPAGVGRSRILSAFVLEAKLAGAIVLRAESHEVDRAEFSVIKALIEDVLEAAPQEAVATGRSRSAILAHISDDLRERFGNPPLAKFSGSAELHARLQHALREWLLAFTLVRPLVIAVDDVHTCDESSAAVLAALARDAQQHRMVVTVTEEVDSDPIAKNALPILREAGMQVTLDVLEEAATEDLLRSVFGKVPFLSSVAAWIHRMSGGNPRTTMELAQQLVDKGLARHEGGAWLLPRSLDDAELPSSVEEIIEARIAALSPTARELAEVLSLVNDLGKLGVQDYARLYERKAEGQQAVFAALDELLLAQVLNAAGEHHAFSNAGLIQALRRNMLPDRWKEAHRQIAHLYPGNDSDSVYIRTHHLRLAGDEDKALDQFIDWMGRGGLTVERPETHDGMRIVADIVEAAVKRGLETGRSPRDMYKLRKTLVLMASALDPLLVCYLPDALDQLEHDSGLIYWGQFEDGDDPNARIGQCLQEAQRVYDATDPSQRGVTFIEAIRELALCVANAAAVYGRNLDGRSSAKLPRYLEPFRSLSPAVDLVYHVTFAAVDSVQGRWGGAWHHKVAALLQDTPEGMGGAEFKQLVAVNTYYLALDEARRGLGSAFAYADELEKDPVYSHLAWLVRMLTHLYTGDAEQAQACRERMELEVVLGGGGSTHLQTSLIYEAMAYAMSGNLMMVKRLIEPMKREAEDHPGWRPLVCMVQGHYHRERGEFAEARQQYEKGLAMIEPGQHVGYVLLMPSLIPNLIRNDEAGLARMMAEEALAKCKELNLHQMGARFIETGLAVAEANLGQIERAQTRLDRILDEALSDGTGGLPLGYIYEALARVAMFANDGDAFEKWARLTAGQYRQGKNPVLVSKYEKLMDEARDAEVSVTTDIAHAAEYSDILTTGMRSSGIASDVVSMLIECGGPEARARRSLALLMDDTHASRGFMYLAHSDGLELAAASQGLAPPRGMPRMAKECLDKEMSIDDQETEAVTDSSDAGDRTWQESNTWTSEDGTPYLPVVLGTKRDGSFVAAGVVALASRRGAVGPPRAELIHAIADALIDMNDVTPRK